MRVAVTGANGFVGQAVCAQLRAAQFQVRPIVRSPATAWPDARAVGNIGAQTDWTNALHEIDCVVHCAARVHVMDDNASDPLTAFRAVNTQGTQRLAEQAVESGVRRLVFLSSLKVLGEQTSVGKPFSVLDTPNPVDPYGQSKWEAEMALRTIERTRGLEVVVIRPPLIIGRGAKANVLKLLQAVARGLPLPLGRIHNRRSLVGLHNLCSLVERCVSEPAAAGQTFLVSDGHDISTPDLIRAMAQALDRPARLLPVPVTWLQLAGRLTGRMAQIERLTGSLQVEIGHTREVLGWKPAVTLQQELQSMVQDGLK